MKRIWKENRVLFLLIVILIVCFVAICSVTVSYFVGSHKSIYGDRLEDKVKIKDSVKKEYIESLEKVEIVNKADFRVSIRTIYIEIELTDNSTLVDAQSKAEASLEILDEEILKYYDVNFILKKEKTETDEGFTIMGAKNSNGTGISWNNNTVVEDN